MTKQQFKDLPDDKKMDFIYELLDMVNSYSVVCFRAGWRRPSGVTSVWDIEKVDKFINDYGKESVKNGFVAARDNGVEKLIYVENVARSDYEKKSIKKNIQKHEEIKKEEKQTPYNFADDPEWQKLKNKMSIK